MTFIATDGTEFTDRAQYRKYEMETQYTFRDRTSERLVKEPNSIQGKPFDIIKCKDCEIIIPDYCDQVQIDEVTGSRIFIGASSGSVFIRNCNNCSFTIACKQLRTRDCDNCTIYLYCETEPIIESSLDMRFAPFNGAYEGHIQSMNDAGLNPKHNKWYAVHDFSDPAKIARNWRIRSDEEEDQLWCPLGNAECCVPRQSPPLSHREYRISETDQIYNSSSEDETEETYDSDEYETEEEDEAEPRNNAQEHEEPIPRLHRAWSFISHHIFSFKTFCIVALIGAGYLHNQRKRIS